ncbi:hypothetical protein F5051DRAFT_401928 [Lentinula edodes]|nr:hypothetical protein F5051DRAFT_401928 [Lentinula edodes]
MKPFSSIYRFNFIGFIFGASTIGVNILFNISSIGHSIVPFVAIIFRPGTCRKKRAYMSYTESTSFAKLLIPNPLMVTDCHRCCSLFFMLSDIGGSFLSSSTPCMCRITSKIPFASLWVIRQQLGSSNLCISTLSSHPSLYHHGSVTNTHLDLVSQTYHSHFIQYLSCFTYFDPFHNLYFG